MADELGVNLEGMREHLESTPVVFALLFGSYAREDADSTSDVDVALRFPEEMADSERFRLRNRIDAELQRFSTGFVDVSDIEALPIPVAHAALRDGIRLAGNEQAIEEYRERVRDQYESTATERERDRQEFLDRLAQGGS